MGYRGLRKSSNFVDEIIIKVRKWGRDGLEMETGGESCEHQPPRHRPALILGNHQCSSKSCILLQTAI